MFFFFLEMFQASLPQTNAYPIHENTPHIQETVCSDQF